MTTTDLKYEDAFKRLEKLVDELEKPELDLDTRFKKFKDALVLSRMLTKRLQQTKKKVEVLVKTHLGEASLTSFDEELSDEPDADRTTA
ncbi:MAG: exodeoxyribonuclease VII small subunit [Candidatus Omnitrophica bacterium]|nr:exodeoxyribonuclease VII small subunit [Candidatus Omnitrophota bacterium]